MASLLDIAKVARKVDVGGVELEVYGISLQSFASLMVRFPELGKLMSGYKLEQAELMKMAPEAVGAIIAAGCGELGNPEAEKAAANLGLGPQTDVIAEVLRLTFPKGVGPFVEKLEGLGVLMQQGLPGLDKNTPSAPPSQTPSSPSPEK